MGEKDKKWEHGLTLIWWVYGYFQDLVTLQDADICRSTL